MNKITKKIVGKILLILILASLITSHCGATFALGTSMYLQRGGSGDEEPGTDEPGIDEPGIDEPGTDEPGTDEPGTEEPEVEKEYASDYGVILYEQKTDLTSLSLAIGLMKITLPEMRGGSGDEEPGTDEPGIDEPGTDEPGTDEPGTDEPGTDEPGIDEPVIDEKIVEFRAKIDFDDNIFKTPTVESFSGFAENSTVQYDAEKSEFVIRNEAGLTEGITIIKLEYKNEYDNTTLTKVSLSDINFVKGETTYYVDDREVNVNSLYMTLDGVFAKEGVLPVEPDEPGTDEPGTDEPGTDEPGTDEPGTDEPGTDEPGTDLPEVRGGAGTPEDENPDDTNPDEENPDNENPDDTNPDEENPDNENPDDTNPDEENQDNENPDDTNPDEENPDNEKVYENKFIVSAGLFNIAERELDMNNLMIQSAIEYDRNVFEELKAEDFKGINGWEITEINGTTFMLRATDEAAIIDDGIVEIEFTIKSDLEKFDETAVKLLEPKIYEGITGHQLEDLDLDINGIEIEAENPMVGQAEMVAVNVFVNNFLTEVSGMSGTITFDTDTFEEIAELSFQTLNGPADVEYDAETHRFHVSNAEVLTKGLMFSVILTAKEDAEIGKTAIYFHNLELDLGETTQKIENRNIVVAVVEGTPTVEPLENKVSLEPNAYTYLQGDEATITVELNEFDNPVTSVSGKIEFDEQIFGMIEETDLHAASDWDVTYDLDTKTFSAVAKEEAEPTSGTVLEIKLKIKDSANVGEAEVKLTDLVVTVGETTTGQTTCATKINIEENIAYKLVVISNRETEDNVVLAGYLYNVLADEPKILEILADVEYDREVFYELTEDDVVYEEPWVNKNESGVTPLYLANEAELVEECKLFKINFRIREDAKPGTTNITFRNIKLTGEDDEILFQLDVNVEVTIEEKVTPVFTMSADKELFLQDDEIKFTIAMEDIKDGVNNAEAVFAYDKEIFEEITMNDIKLKDGWMTFDEEFNGKLSLINTKFKTNGTIAEITLKVKEHAAIKETSIVLSEIKLSDEENEIIFEDITITGNVEEYVTETFKVVEGKYMGNIELGATLEDLLNDITTAKDVKLFDAQGNEVVAESAKLATGMKLTIGEKTFDIVVTADLSGDGELTALDVAKMKEHIIKRMILEGAYEKAADLSGDSKTTALDVAKIKNLIIGYVDNDEK